MTSLYKFTCSCGATHPVETAQAGRMIECSCGKSIKIPSMLKIKQLPRWTESPEQKSDSPESINLGATEKKGPSSQSVARPRPSDTVSNVSSVSLRENSNALKTPAPKKKSAGSATQKGLFIVGIIATILFSTLLIRSMMTPPSLIDVLRIQRYYLQDGKVIQRDSNPIDSSDAYFFVTQDQTNLVIDDWVIDHFTPFYAYDYFNYLKTGPKLSDNFYDKYDSLIIRRHLNITFYGIFTILSLGVFIMSFVLVKRRKATVGVMRGSDWKS